MCLLEGGMRNREKSSVWAPKKSDKKSCPRQTQIEQPGKIKLFLFISLVSRTQFFTKWKLKAVFLFGIKTQSGGGSKVEQNQQENHPCIRLSEPDRTRWEGDLSLNHN